MLDLRDLGFNYFFVQQTQSTKGGADISGEPCMDGLDYEPCTIPIPCIEIQPVAP